MTYANDSETARNCDRMMLHAWRLSIPNIHGQNKNGQNTDGQNNDQMDYHDGISSAGQKGVTWGAQGGRMWFQAADLLQMYMKEDSK